MEIIPYTYKGERKPWNLMQFNSVTVLSTRVDQFEKAGKRMTVEVEAPKLRKKFFLYAWEDNGVLEAVESASLKEGDIISVNTELSYYKNKEKHCEAFQIVGNPGFSEGATANEWYFPLLCVVKRKADAPAPTDDNGYLSKNDLLKMMLG